MEDKDIIENRVASSGLITIDLGEYLDDSERIMYDLKDNLFQGLILKEKEFRAFIKTHDWASYKGKHVALNCTADAIVPSWAYMLLTTKLSPYANTIVYGDMVTLEREIINKALDDKDFSRFKGGKIVIKGCAELKDPEYAFVEVTKRLMPFASSIMYGEPCSTVPIIKLPRKA
jgi:hypothetical protein